MCKDTALKTLLQFETLEEAIDFLEKSHNFKPIIYIKEEKSFFHAKSSIKDISWAFRIAADYFFIHLRGRNSNTQLIYALLDVQDKKLAVDKLFKTRQEAEEYRKINFDVFFHKSIKCIPLVDDILDLVRILYILVTCCGNDIYRSDYKKFDARLFKIFYEHKILLNLTASASRTADAIIKELDSSMSVCRLQSSPDLLPYKLRVLENLKTICVEYRAYCLKSPENQRELPKSLIELFSISDGAAPIELRRMFDEPSKSNEIELSWIGAQEYKMGYTWHKYFIPIADSLQKRISSFFRDKQQVSLGKGLQKQHQAQSVESTATYIFEDIKDNKIQTYYLPHPFNFLPSHYYFAQSEKKLHFYEKNDIEGILYFIEKISSRISDTLILSDSGKKTVFREALDFFNSSNIYPVNEVNMIIFTLLQAIFYNRYELKNRELVPLKELKPTKSAMALLALDTIPHQPYKFERYYSLRMFREIRKKNFSDIEKYIEMLKFVFDDNNMVDAAFLSNDECKLKAYATVSHAIMDCKFLLTQKGYAKSLSQYKVCKSEFDKFNPFFLLLAAVKRIYENNPNDLFVNEGNVSLAERKWEFITEGKQIYDSNLDSDCNLICKIVREMKERENKDIDFRFITMWISCHARKKEYSFTIFRGQLNMLLRVSQKPGLMYLAICYILFKMGFNASGNGEDYIIEYLCHAAKYNYVPALTDIGLILGYEYMFQGERIAFREFPGPNMIGTNMKKLQEKLINKLSLDSTTNLWEKAREYLRLAADRGYAHAQYYLFLLLSNIVLNKEEKATEEKLKEEGRKYLRKAIFRKLPSAINHYFISQEYSNRLDQDCLNIIAGYVVDEVKFPTITLRIKNHPHVFPGWIMDMLELIKWQADVCRDEYSRFADKYIKELTRPM